ncbi:MAG TPA: thiol-disulfide oxidoreductase DCC family protein [Myxococcota bacterium]|nr:thiol-disulfide oxidoreductase DCC family protein [Myxococcota bacterium]
MAPHDLPADASILLFDGVCNFCNGAVRFLVPRDRAGRLRFASLQSETGAALQRRFGLDPDDLGTVVLVEGDRCHVKSDALLRVVRHLSGAWPLFALLRIVPRPLRDWVYDRFAARRYRWFGRSDACLVPTPELRERFLA